MLYLNASHYVILCNATQLDSYITRSCGTIRLPLAVWDLQFSCLESVTVVRLEQVDKLGQAIVHEAKRMVNNTIVQSCTNGLASCVVCIVNKRAIQGVADLISSLKFIGHMPHTFSKFDFWPPTPLLAKKFTTFFANCCKIDLPPTNILTFDATLSNHKTLLKISYQS